MSSAIRNPELRVFNEPKDLTANMKVWRRIARTQYLILPTTNRGTQFI